MFLRPNRFYIRTLKTNWWKNFLSLVTYGCGLCGILLPFIQETSLSYSLILIIVLIFIIIVSFLFAIPNCYRKFRLVGTGGNAIELVIGDMLSDCNDMVIPSNNYFDTSWSVISRKSIQGQLANKYLSLTYLDKVIDEAIKKAGLKGTYNESKNIGKRVEFPINSIITIQDSSRVDSQRYYWVAMTNFSDKGEIIKEDVDIHSSIMCLWEHLRKHVHVRNLCIPVLGTGLTPTSVSQFDVIEVIVDTFLTEITKSKIVDTLRIYLYYKGDDTYSTFHLASQYIQHRIENLPATELKHKF